MLDISRSGISSTTITDYGTERFIKLPIDKYLGLLGIDPCGPQIAIINATNDPRFRFIVAAISRRLGKTFIANIIAQMVSLVPGCNILIMSPNYSLSSISFEEQRRLIKLFDLEVVKDNSKDRVIELANGSTVRMGSVSQVDSCVGRSYDLIVFDEAALTSDGQKAFEIALRPTLDKPGSKAIFISTPRGKNNWFSKYFSRGYTNDYPSWVSIHADWRENPRVSLEDINDARRSMSDAEFKQEYEASFNSFEGQIYKFNMENIDEPEAGGEYEYIMGLDIGFKDDTAAVVLAFDYDTKIYWVVAEYMAAEKTSSQHAMVIKELMEKYGIEYIFIDSAAQQTRYDWAVDHDIATTNATKSVLDGIAYVQNLVDNNRLKVSPNCPHVLASLDQYRWNDNPNLIVEKPVHDEFSHMADALRYALYSYTTSICSV